MNGFVELRGKRVRSNEKKTHETKGNRSKKVNGNKTKEIKRVSDTQKRLKSIELMVMAVLK